MHRMVFASLFATAVTTGSVQAAVLGDPAPPITPTQWIKGAPVQLNSASNLVVIEFWATWCGPCKRSIPHLTELQRKYRDRGVQIAGFSDEAAPVVAAFVNSQGGAMDYHVAIDPSRRTFQAWMPAYGQSGIPHAFIVQAGRVIWHGFPNEDLDRALDQMLAGTYDIEHAKNRDIGERLVDQYTEVVKAPNAAKKAAPLGDRILNEYSRSWLPPYYLSKAILSDPEVRSRDIDLALRAASKATEITEHRSWDALGMLARAQYASGKKSEAIQTQKEALAICKNAEDRVELEKFLALFEQQAAKTQ